MEFIVYKILNIDSVNGKVIIFKLDGGYIAIRIPSNSFSILDEVTLNSVLNHNTNLYFICTKYVTDSPNEIFKDPEDALFNIFIRMYKNYNKNIKL